MLSFDQAIAVLLQHSRYAAQILARHDGESEFRDWLAISYAQSAVTTIEQLCAQVRGARGAETQMPATTRAPSADLARALRLARERAMLAILLRDLSGAATLNEVVTAISMFADQSVAIAVDFHRRTLLEAWGIDDCPQADFIVVGMGKLGGYELNVSSDIDLIFLYAEDGAASAERSWHEFHAELGRRVIRALDDIDENGFVFRVDMRLRPFGSSGPLVCSLLSLSDYFQKHARPWERYAWLKSRAIAGVSAHVTQLDTIVRPFVYRRYHDYAAIDEMRALHAQIRAEATKRGKQEDIKVGAGGIRECEFVAQLPQLIRGGRESAWQTRSTRAALQLAAQPALIEAYTFLRNLEHRLQYLDDQQTQTLPSNALDQALIAQSMGFTNWEVFVDALNLHRATVTNAFDRAFGTQLATVAPTARNAADDISKNALDPLKVPVDKGVSGISSEASITDTAFRADAQAAINARVSAWQNSQRMASLSPKIRERLAALIARAVAITLPFDDSTTTIFRVFALLEAIDKRETYLALLMAYPDVLPRVVRLMHKSAWAADLLTRHPVLLDEFTQAPRAQAGLDWAAERAQLLAQCNAAASDVERQYEILRHTKQIATLKLNIADVEGRLSVMSLSDELSALADMLLDVAVTLAWRALTKEPDATPAGFGVIGYGKLGSKELGYASDLDIVFVTDAQSAIPAEQYARLAQRINSWLTTMTAGGVVYETDLRLRPDGASGLLVTTLDAFADYQTHRAWTWEHQALTRARFCAGDAALAPRFNAIREQILTLPRDRKKLREDIIEMRNKMRAEKKDKTDGPAPLDLKNTVGGIVDVEFIVQYLILAYSHEHPEFTKNLGNFALLTRAAALGIIDEDAAAGVAKAYLAYRDRLHAAQNNNERKAWIGRDELVNERAAVAQLWRAMFG